MSEDLPTDQAARLRAVAHRGSVLVQAPAGSGKTTLLAQRYLRLLSAVDAPERILALTFTRRAAEEMRERVIRALKAAARPDCPADCNPQSWALAVSARRHLLELDIDVERHPSRLRIETIDSFNAWLAAQLPITSGAGGRLTLLDNARPLYEEAARRALMHEGAGSFAAAVDQVLAVADQRWNPLLDLIVEMLPARDRWLRLLVGRLRAAGEIDEPQLREARRHFDEDLELLVTRALRNAHEALGGETLASLSPLMHVAALRLSGQRPEFGPWETDETPLRPEPGDIGRWRAVSAMLLTRGSDLRRQVTKSEGFPPRCAEKGAMTDLLAQLEGRPPVVQVLRSIRVLPDPRYSDDDWDRVRAAAQVLVLAAAELEQVFREQGAVDFPAVSMAAARALGTAELPTDLGLRLDYRLQHLLLDEFQDTSSAQLELVRLLTAGWQRGDGRSVFCVGDPMQSIYGFRQAEVRAFLELADEGLGEVQFEVQRLSSNFRSHRALVEWINARFEPVMPRVDDRERGAIAFRPSDSTFPPSPGLGPGVGLRRLATRSAEALAVADLVEEQRERHPEWRVAVLVRARAHAREIAHGLRMRGIAFRAVDIEPVQDRPAVRDLVMLICALLHRGDRTAWLAVLRAPWAGVTLAELLIIARAGPIVWDAICDEAVLEQLSAEGARRCRRLRAVLETAFRVQTHDTVRRWAERTWLALGGPGCVSDAAELAHVRTVLARLRELEDRGLPDPADLVRSFADLYADGGAVDGGAGGAVEIMTIHKAKGLEFDLVIVPALDRPARATRSQLLLMHPFARTGRDGMVMAARPAIGAGPNRLFEFLRRQARDATGLEAQRLLYVACTRAKRQLYLTAVIGSREDPDDPLEEDAEEGGEAAAEGRPDAMRPPHPGSLLAVLWPTVREEFARATTAPPAQAAPPGPPAPPAPAEPVTSPAPAINALRGGPLFRVPLEGSPGSGDSTGRGTDLAAAGRGVGGPLGRTLLDAAPRRPETPVFDWVGETARRVGSLVHAELQVMDLDRIDEAAIRARAPHFKRWLALHGVPAEWLSQACERVTAALIGVHRDPRGRWILQGGVRDDFREHALSGSWRGEVVHAVFDRSFIDRSGVRWVIDYKTSHHAGGGLEEFLQREVERYRPQLERYAVLARRLGPELVRVGLYFPLMGAWREWAPEG